METSRFSRDKIRAVIVEDGRAGPAGPARKCSPTSGVEIVGEFDNGFERSRWCRI